MIIEQFINRTKTAVINAVLIKNFHNIIYVFSRITYFRILLIHLRKIIAELTNQLLNEVISRAFENSIYF